MWRPFDRLCEGLSDSAAFIPREKWTKVENRLVRVLECLDTWGGRAIVIGLSDVYRAWTDGSTYIAIDRNYLHRFSFTSNDSVAGLFATLIHETAHDCQTNGSHCHGEEFYRNFHNLCIYGTVDMNSQYANNGGAFRHLNVFCNRMKNAVLQERFDAVVAKEKRAAASVNRALNGKRVAASSKTALPCKKRRRIPHGAKRRVAAVDFRRQGELS